MEERAEGLPELIAILYRDTWVNEIQYCSCSTFLEECIAILDCGWQARGWENKADRPVARATWSRMSAFTC